MKPKKIARKLVKMYSSNQLTLRKEYNNNYQPFHPFRVKNLITKYNIIKNLFAKLENNIKNIKNNNKVPKIQIVDDFGEDDNDDNDYIFGHPKHDYSPNMIKEFNYIYGQTINEIKKCKNIRRVIDNLDKKRLFTPIPKIKYKPNKLNNKEIKLCDEAKQTVVIIRRLEYNDYLYKKNDEKVRILQQLRARRKLMNMNAMKIQKNYKGYSIREVKQKVENLKLHECAVEIFLLMAYNNYIKALKRKAFNILKEFEEEKKALETEESVDDEIKFSDRIKMKLNENYYFFNSRKNCLKRNIIHKKRAKSKS